MKFKGTWVFAIFAIALGAYIYLIEFKKAAQDDEQKEKSEKVLDVDQFKMKTFSIKNSQGDFNFEKDGDNWKLVQPVQAPADSQAIGGMFSSLNGEKYEQTIEGEDPKNFGLTEPHDVLTVTMVDGSVKKISVGSDAPLPGKVYLQRAGENKILYANSSFKVQLEKGMKDFRDKQIFKKPKDEVLHVVAKYNTKENHGKVSLTKNGTDWFIDSLKEKADQDAANAFVAGIEGLRAADFASEKGDDKAELKKDGLTQPQIDVTLYGKDDEELGHLRLSPKEKDPNVNVVVVGSPTVYKLFASAADSLVKKDGDFRDKRKPLEFKKDDVTDIFVKTSLTEVHLQKKGANWEMPVTDPLKQVSQIQVSNFLDKVGALKIADYVEKGETAKGFNEPTGHIILKDAKDEVLFDMKWGERAKVARSYYAKSVKFPGALTIDGASLDAIPVQTLIENKATPTPVPTPGGTPAAVGGAPVNPSLPPGHP